MHLSESDTRAKYIDPKLKQDGWSDGFVIREYYSLWEGNLSEERHDQKNLLIIYWNSME